ncbi:MAG TPA: DNA (cytosine-5-)-methyltransferase [Fulvivirga sp.]|nr:DNA (cytosine-5-)-methyltransferase [Fulvivirga sp.]
MKCAIDLYSGIGGWTLGMKLSGIQNVASYEWWNEANQTHNLNFNTNHKEINIRNIDAAKDLNYKQKIDFVVGSPPCTQFSFANKGGNGNISDGLIDVIKFLEIVEYLKPKYWAMENVPRVAKILEKELNGGALQRFNKLVKIIKVVDCADYGVPQNRKRMIAGNFPEALFDSYKLNINKLNLGEVIASLNQEVIIDPNYGYQIPKSEVTELDNEVNLTYEEERINRDSKTYHPVYNKMAFPDKLDRPSRTITATCTRVSRESVVIKAKNGYRRLNVRERGVLQGFPITYQFYGKTLNSKFKMIGNAVPPLLTYYIFQSMLETKASDIKSPKENDYFHEKPPYKPHKSNLGLPKRKFPAKRKFQFSVPNLRYGSGVRFELSNNPKSEKEEWSFKFFHGNSKNIKQIKLDHNIKQSLAPIINTSRNEIFTECINKISTAYDHYTSERLQELWTSTDLNDNVFEFLDHVGDCVEEIIKETNFNGFDSSLIESIVQEKNRKLDENKESILVGFYFLSSLNKKLFHK